MTADLLQFPARQAEPEEWEPVRQSYSPYPRGWNAFGEPFTPPKKQKGDGWPWKFFAGWLAACWFVVLMSVVW